MLSRTDNGTAKSEQGNMRKMGGKEERGRRRENEQVEGEPAVKKDGAEGPELAEPATYGTRDWCFLLTQEND